MRNVDLPLLQFEQVVATPHIGYVTHEEYETQFSDVFDQIVAFAAGRPINVVNPDAGTAVARRGSPWLCRDNPFGGYRVTNNVRFQG